MRIVLQKVRSAGARVSGETVGAIGPGLVALVAIEKGDDESTVALAAGKLAGVRCFPDREGRMNLDPAAAAAGFLVISQFTLAARLDRGRRPSFERAEEPERAREMVDLLTVDLRGRGFEVETGSFGAHMEVELVNDGPVTLILEL